MESPARGTNTEPSVEQGGMAETQQPMLDEAQPASPEEQAQYNEFVAQAFKVIYGEGEVPKPLLDMLKGGGDEQGPMEGLARAATMITARVAVSGEEAGKRFPLSIVEAAGKEILEELAEVSRRAGIKDFSKDEDALEGAYFRAVDMFRVLMQQDGRIDQQQYQQKLQTLQQMDQSGELEQVFVKAAERDAQAKAAPEGQEQPTRRGLMGAM